MVEAAERMAAAFRASLPPDAVDPGMIFKVRLRDGGVVPDDEWKRAGLGLVSQEGAEAVILFTDDSQLQAFRTRAAAYTDGPPVGQKNAPHASFFDAIDELERLSPADRIGAALRFESISTEAHFEDAETYILDLELWRPAEEMVDIVTQRAVNAFEGAGGEVLSEFRAASGTILRGQGPGSAFRAVLQLQEVAAVDRPPMPDLEEGGAPTQTIADIAPAGAPEPLASTIGIIDSGVASGHPLLEQVVDGAFGVGNLGDADDHGHGTGVAAIAAYGDLSQMIGTGVFQPRFKIASARVVDATGSFPRDIVVAEAMEQAIRTLHAEHGCRVINISLGNPKRLTGPKASTWAETLDSLARELDLVVILAAGNVNSDALIAAHGDQVVDAYPHYLLEEEANAVLDPAGAAIAVTVGSIAPMNGLSADDDVAVRPFCDRDQPSPFTRRGPGLAGAIKPDLVDYGGTGVYDGFARTIKTGKQHPAAGVITLNNEYQTRLFAMASGTSQAAPLVAHKAAAIVDRFPDASANLVRSLLGLSASQSDTALDRVGEIHERDAYSLLGYGHADVASALFSDDDRVVLTDEDVLPLDKFAVYEIPVPLAFQATRGERHISVALAFDPPVRRTRKDYTGVRMSFELVRGCTAEQVFDAYRRIPTDVDKPEALRGALTPDLRPKKTVRNTSTLQAASYSMHQNIDQYGDAYHLVVRTHGGWAEGMLEAGQRFAVAVMLRHEARIGLYSQIQARLRARNLV